MTSIRLQEEPMSEQMARVAYLAARGDSSDQKFESLPKEAQETYRAVASAVIEGLAPHVAALARMMVMDIGNKLHVAEHKAQTLSSQLYDTREWALEAETDKRLLLSLLNEAKTFVVHAKWQGDIAATGLLQKIEEAVAKVGEHSEPAEEPKP